MMSRKKTGQKTVRSLQKGQRSHRVSLQDGIKGREKQSLGDPKRPGAVLLETLGGLNDLLRIYQRIGMPGQFLVGMMVLLLVGGMVALFILVTVLPNGYIGISSLLTTVGGFIIGRGSVQKKPSERV